ncbi:hypothetical protein [Flexibacterium corallicola]|uniref:hypothetical protein n=1 Tax=Flexibacterium corallicola TaxID=3037259 RepID=UPI00286F27A4|nr:hypothetical protein [Pseudovibrio sp. M1P-2-3]
MSASDGMSDQDLAVAKAVYRKVRSGIYGVKILREDGSVIAKLRGISRSLNETISNTSLTVT